MCLRDRSGVQSLLLRLLLLLLLLHPALHCCVDGDGVATPAIAMHDTEACCCCRIGACTVQARAAGLPLVVVLGVTRSPALLLQLLPNALLRRVSPTLLTLPAARQQLSQLYRCVL